MSEKTLGLERHPVNKCPICGNSPLVHDYECAELVCKNCGYVITERFVDRGPEWRAFNPEQRAKRVRVGAPFTFTIHDKGLSTNIDWRNRDIRGKRLPSKQRAQINRLRNWQRRVQVSGSMERNLTSALSEMSRITDKLNLPRNILETASIIYRTAIKEHLIRGRSIQAMAAAAIYVACRRCRLIRTLDEVAQASKVEKKELGRGYRLLVKELDYFVPPVKNSKYVTALLSKLALKGKGEEVAHKILRAAKELKLTSGRAPKSVAAAVSYMASKITGEYRTQREIAEAAQITEVTIRNRYKELMEYVLIVTSL
jgi:transcription initiation factor TFIIB